MKEEIWYAPLGKKRTACKVLIFTCKIGNAERKKDMSLSEGIEIYFFPRKETYHERQKREHTKKDRQAPLRKEYTKKDRQAPLRKEYTKKDRQAPIRKEYIKKDSNFFIYLLF
jgi:hypothetical protein